MRSAADLEDSTEKHPVTPGAVLPARELLGDLLLELNRPAEALKEFERSQTISPNRFNGLYGAARSAELAGDPIKARRYYQKLVQTSSLGNRPALQDARDFLVNKPRS
jgi:tetratricopeptide (TPR) repeat protein